MERWAFLILFLFSLSPAYAETTFTVTNHTSAYGTAKVMFTCSSSAGAEGVIPPHSVHQIPNIVLDYFCKHKCSVNIFMNKNCNGKSAGVISLDRKKGITKVEDHHVGNFKLSATQFNLIVDQT